MDSIQTVDIDNQFIEKIKSAIEIELQYESLTKGKRKNHFFQS